MKIRRILEPLEKAKSAKEILSAALEVGRQFDAAYEISSAGQSERKKLNVPNTDRKKKIALLKAFATITGNYDEETRWTAVQLQLATQEALNPYLGDIYDLFFYFSKISRILVFVITQSYYLS